jgi:hypothetical protein
MARIPVHTLEDSPPSARPLLAEVIQFSPAGRLLNMHAQMAHAPAVLEAYVPIRRATARNGTLDQRARTALMLVYAATGLDVPAGPAHPDEHAPASPALPGQGA